VGGRLGCARPTEGGGARVADSYSCNSIGLSCITYVPNTALYTGPSSFHKPTHPAIHPVVTPSPDICPRPQRQHRAQTVRQRQRAVLGGRCQHLGHQRALAQHHHQGGWEMSAGGCPCLFDQPPACSAPRFPMQAPGTLLVPLLHCYQVLPANTSVRDTALALARAYAGAWSASIACWKVSNARDRPYLACATSHSWWPHHKRSGQARAKAAVRPRTSLHQPSPLKRVVRPVPRPNDAAPHPSSTGQVLCPGVAPRHGVPAGIPRQRVRQGLRRRPQVGAVHQDAAAPRV
jgi:hypothetical protein